MVQPWEIVDDLPGVLPPWRRGQEVVPRASRGKRSYSAGPSAQNRMQPRPKAAAAPPPAIEIPPRPTRDVPYFVLEAHDVRPGDELDVDWTLSHDWAEERRLRDIRNKLIREQLQSGLTVGYRQSGWSLWPRVHSNDLCCYIPVRFQEQVQVNDIVFCQVHPGQYYYAHLVRRKEEDPNRGEYVFWIGNMAGRLNGHCYLDAIYGKLVQVLH